MKLIIVMCVIVLYFTESVHSFTVDDFLSRIPGWDSISTAWNKIVIAIKKPVKIRRWASIWKRKTTTSQSVTPLFSDPTYIITTEAPANQNVPHSSLSSPAIKKSIPYSSILASPDWSASVEMPPELRRITFPENEYQLVTAPGDGRVKLPYIPEPIWKTLEDWQQMQKPHFVKILRSKDADFEALGSERKLADIPEEERFGVLLFV